MPFCAILAVLIRDLNSLLPPEEVAEALFGACKRSLSYRLGLPARRFHNVFEMLSNGAQETEWAMSGNESIENQDGWDCSETYIWGRAIPLYMLHSISDTI